MPWHEWAKLSKQGCVFNWLVRFVISDIVGYGNDRSGKQVFSFNSVAR